MMTFKHCFRWRLKCFKVSFSKNQKSRTSMPSNSFDVIFFRERYAINLSKQKKQEES